MEEQLWLRGTPGPVLKVRACPASPQAGRAHLGTEVMRGLTAGEVHIDGGWDALMPSWSSGLEGTNERGGGLAEGPPHCSIFISMVQLV